MIAGAMLDLVSERVERRRRQWQTSEDDLLPPPDKLGEVCIYGSFSVAGLETKRRYLAAPVCIGTPAGLDTPPTLARDYLTLVYKKSPPVKHEQVLFLRANTLQLPLYAEPSTFANGYYLDIVSTYFSLMLVVGWNLDYWPARWLSAGRPPVDFPFSDNKLARNCLVSAGMGGRIQLYKPGVGYMEIKTGNHLANLQLYCLIADVLNCIAAEMVEAGAVYVNTDGYILPDYASLERAVKILTDWQLPTRVKASGAGVVRGAGTYYIGPAKSKRVMSEPASINTIKRPAWADWLKRNFTIHASRRAENAQP